MAIQKETIGSGITKRVKTRFVVPLDRTELDIAKSTLLRAGPRNFETLHARPLESAARRILAASHSIEEVSLEPHSSAWYAREILTCIARLRGQRAVFENRLSRKERTSLDLALRFALEIGDLGREAVMKFHWEDDALARRRDLEAGRRVRTIVSKGVRETCRTQAAEVWRRHPKLSVLGVARIVATNLANDPQARSLHTIRRYICDLKPTDKES